MGLGLYDTFWSGQRTEPCRPRTHKRYAGEEEWANWPKSHPRRVKSWRIMKRQKTKNPNTQKWNDKWNQVELLFKVQNFQKLRKNQLFSFLWKNLEKSEARYAWKNKCGLLSLFFINFCDCCWSKYWYLYLLVIASQLHYQYWKTNKEEAITATQQMWRESVCIVRMFIK